MTEVRKFLIVVNPVTRRGADLLVQRVRELAPEDSAIEVFHTRPEHIEPGDLRQACQGCEAVIAIGGDGTVAEAATGIDQEPVALGIIPAGSTNIIARNLGLPLDIDEAIRIVFERPATKRMDVGLCNGRRFLHMGGAGFDSRIFATTSKRLKRHLGWVAYFQGASQTLFDPPVRFAVTVDGETLQIDSPLILVANGGSVIHPSIEVHPGIHYDDGELDVVIFTATRAVEIASTLGRFATRSLDKSPFTLHLRGKQIELVSQPPIPVQLDGDIVGNTPAHFSLIPAALEVIVPR